MIQNIDLKDIITNSKLDLFLKGSDGYSLINRQADMPTDNMLVVEHLKNYYLQTKDELTWTEFEKALIAVSGDKEFLFLIPLYIHSYLYVSKELNIHPVNLANVKAPFSKAIMKYSSYLKDNKSWIGANMEGGLLGHMLYMINLIKKNFGISIIEDDLKL